MSLTTIYGDLTPLPNDILVVDMEQGAAITKTGLYLLDDSVGSVDNIKPRWARVYKVGKNITEIHPDEWVLIEHGRWTYGMNLDTGAEKLYIQKIDVKSILMTSDKYPGDIRIKY
jgi:hypothetical protein